MNNYFSIHVYFWQNIRLDECLYECNTNQFLNFILWKFFICHTTGNWNKILEKLCIQSLNKLLYNNIVGIILINFTFLSA